MLRHLGFAPRTRTGTSHELWVKGEGKDYRRVTVDSHHAPYHRRLLQSMLKQAGLSKSEFFSILEGL